jgi:hypothetical protein
MDPDLAQVAREHEHSSHWQAHVKRLRELARGDTRGAYRNSTGPLDQCSWEELLALAEEGRRSASERPRGHRRNRLTEADEGNRHVRDYLAGCRKYARSLGSDGLAERVHAMVCGQGYLVDVSGYVANRPWELGHPASAMAAHIHRRADFGVGTAANRMMWVRHRPLAIPIEVLVDPSICRLPTPPGGIGTLTPTANGAASPGTRPRAPRA